MRMLLKVSIPVEAGNKAIKDGSLPRTIGAFVEQWKPESCYFIAQDGLRTGYMAFDLKDPTQIPSVAEPFFMNLGATIELTPAMNLEDLKAGVAKAMAKT